MGNNNEKLFLLIEDNPEICELVVMVLENFTDMKVMVCSDEEEAIGFVETLTFEGILIDKNVGDIDGCKLAKRLAELSPETKMVGFSGDPFSKEDFIEAGCSDFVPKPFDSDELVNAVTND